MASTKALSGCVAKNGCLVLTMVDCPDPESSSEVCLWPKPNRIVSKLGVGGMGEVWRARDTQLDR